MAPKVFITGVTGYIGGDIFDTLSKAHPDWSYTLLVRNQERGAAVAEKYPSAKLVYGDLSSHDILSAAASEADVVVHAAHSDHQAAARAIIAGLSSGHSPQKPGYLIFVSGTGMLMYHDIKAQRHGQPPAEGDAYDDFEGVDKVLALPEDAIHRDVEKIVQAANSDRVRTAIVAPPMIYGPGRGPGNGRSIQVYDLVKYTLTHGYAPVIGTGKSEWHEVHVHDLSDLFVSLVEVAALDPEKAKNEEIFGERAYFFAENGLVVWGEIAELVAKEAKKQGLIEEETVKVVTMEDAIKESKVNASWGLNSKSKAVRGRKLLGWKPTRRSVVEEIPDIVAGEAKLSGITAKSSAV